MPSRLLLFAHGSRDPAWRAPFEALAARLERELGPGRVGLAWLEFGTPSLEDEIARAGRDGVRRVRVLPLFLAAGAHVRRDLPERVAAIRRSRPEVEIDLLPPVGEDARTFDLLAALAREASEPSRR